MDWADSILSEKDGAKRKWSQKIDALRSLVREEGPIWPQSTKLSGYAEKGPYHCGNCKYLESGKYCSQPVVNADNQVKKEDGKPVVNAAHGCCEFVEPKGG